MSGNNGNSGRGRASAGGRDTGDGGHRGPLRMFTDAVALFGARVHAVRPDQWQAPTPDTEWSVRDLVNHLTVEQLWVPPLVQEHATVEEYAERLDGDQLGDDPVAVWDRAAAAAVAAFAAPGALRRRVHLSYGDTAASAYCSQMALDATVHAWDLSRALGEDEALPPHLVAFAQREIGPYGEDLSASGLFAPPVPVPDDADAQTKLLATLGRKA